MSRLRCSLSLGLRRQRTNSTMPAARTRTVAAIRIRSRFGNDGIFEDTDTRDLNSNDRSGFDGADAWWSPSGDEVARLERHHSANVSDDSTHAENHFSHRAILFDVAINQSSDT